MGNVGRILTIVVEIRDDKQAEALWKSIATADGSVLAAGCKVFQMANENQLDERDKYEEVIDKAMENDGNHYDDDSPEKVTTKCGKTFYLHPFGIYSSSENNYGGEQWFTSLGKLKDEYEVIE